MTALAGIKSMLSVGGQSGVTSKRFLALRYFQAVVVDMILLLQRISKQNGGSTPEQIGVVTEVIKILLLVHASVEPAQRT